MDGMARIFPTRAVSAITTLFPDALVGGSGAFEARVMADIKSVLSIIDKVPEELLVLNDEDYAHFIVALNELQIISDWFVAHAKPEPGTTQPAWNYGRPEQNPIGRIVKALIKCPDQYPPPETKALLFVDDIALRDSIRSDAGAVDRAITNNEWKAATVFSGSAIEALLLWKVSKYALPVRKSAIDDSEKLQKLSDLGGRPRSRLDRWTLGQLIVVAEKLGCITSPTACAAHLARNFRDLIHPAKSVRTGAVSNRATAYSAAGALAHVVEDLSS
jgi:hypothetical protein